MDKDQRSGLFIIVVLLLVGVAMFLYVAGSDKKFESELTSADSTHIAIVLDQLSTLKAGDLVVMKQDDPQKDSAVYMVEYGRRNSDTDFALSVYMYLGDGEPDAIHLRRWIFGVARFVRLEDPDYKETLARFLHRE